jgi:hypothetical protein
MIYCFLLIELATSKVNGAIRMLRSPLSPVSLKVPITSLYPGVALVAHSRILIPHPYTIHNSLYDSSGDSALDTESAQQPYD